MITTLLFSLYPTLLHTVISKSIKNNWYLYTINRRDLSAHVNFKAYFSICNNYLLILHQNFN